MQPSVDDKFDASIDLIRRDIPPSIPPHAAVDAVRGAVEALPGAQRVRVEYCGTGHPSIPSERLIRIWEWRGGYRHPDEARIARIVRETCQAVLANQ
jgi:hypothetical protein